ncbi:Peptidase T [Emticicia aquatica]|uniref:Peptidase T n=1 Tax=Emticicia aquatica TaxID=1681835 RepID=A0ABM9APG1_9BACT|nr:peptidase T [Emticicia aquatica]CAH0995807.1 Peptidase T [Emticicia aquatica]
MSNNITLDVGSRFLNYVKIDTQSDPNSNTNPSTEKQKDLSRILVQELLDIGISDAHLDEWGYVYATIPSNSDKKVPTICFCSHVDTSPDCSGANVKPIVHFNWQGNDIILPDDNAQIIKVEEHPDLKSQIGNDIITASGTTLLGADNKAGIAEIMAAAKFLMNNSEIKHGTIKILFTPDEEVGRGTEKVDLEKLGADFAYTMDGESLGTLEDETFSADAVTLTIHGVSTHPGFAIGKLENAMKIAGDILSALPKDTLSPETTEGMEGFIHPTQISGIQESVKLDFIIRDFTVKGLKEKENFLQNIVNQTLEFYPNSSIDFKIIEQYRNMKEVLVNYPHVVDFAMEAIEMTGIRPERRSIRGGTDGSRLSFMGLPCPNIFAGEHAFHSKLEWVSVQDMEKATQVIINLVQIWEKNA